MGGIFKAVGQFASGQYVETAETVWNLILGWKFFLENEVVVGITEETSRDEGAFTSAGLLYLHEQGVPSRNIVPRPVLRPAISDDKTKEKIEALMQDAAEAALVDGDMGRAKDDFEKAGMVGRDACKAWITEQKVAPNKPSTIAKKKRKHQNNKGEPVALIDTGAMLEAITYAVRRKK